MRVKVGDWTSRGSIERPRATGPAAGEGGRAAPELSGEEGDAVGRQLRGERGTQGFGLGFGRGPPGPHGSGEAAEGGAEVVDEVGGGEAAGAGGLDREVAG